MWKNKRYGKKWFELNFSKLKNLILPQEPEFIQYLPGKSIDHGFSSIKHYQVEYIIDVINEELENSKKHGFFLFEEHEKREKEVILCVFNHWSKKLMKDGPNYSTEDREKVIEEIHNTILHLLSEQTDYYYQYFSQAESQTGKQLKKNGYFVHLNNLTTRLVDDFIKGRCKP